MSTKGTVALLDAVQGLFEGQDGFESWTVRAFVTDDGVFVKAKDIFNQTTHRLFISLSGRTHLMPGSLYMRRFDSDNGWEFMVRDILSEAFVQWLESDGCETPPDEYKEDIEDLRSRIRDFLEFLS